MEQLDQKASLAKIRALIVYNDHKRVHGVKFQSMAIPNGIIGNMYGPIGKGNGKMYGANTSK